MAANQNAGAGMYTAAAGANNAHVVPAAGHHSDMQTLMQNMETLSGWLQQNREDWGVLMEGLGRVEGRQSRLAREGHWLQNGDARETDDYDAPTIAHLQSQLSASQSLITSLETTNTEQTRLNQLFESALAETTDRIRHYCFEQQNYITSLHAHYAHLLQQSRYETIEAQLVHQQWQAGLKRVSEGVREAMNAREREGEPWRRRVSRLKAENRVLRAKVGWEAIPDSDDEEEEEVEEGSQDRGREGQGQGIAGGGFGGSEALPLQ